MSPAAPRGADGAFWKLPADGTFVALAPRIGHGHRKVIGLNNKSSPA
jgi:hypothetical protein